MSGNWSSVRYRWIPRFLLIRKTGSARDSLCQPAICQGRQNNRIANAPTKGGDARAPEEKYDNFFLQNFPRDFEKRVFFLKIPGFRGTKNHSEKKSSYCFVGCVSPRVQHNRVANPPTECGDACTSYATSCRGPTTTWPLSAGEQIRRNSMKNFVRSGLWLT